MDHLYNLLVPHVVNPYYTLMGTNSIVVVKQIRRFFGSASITIKNKNVALQQSIRREVLELSMDWLSKENCIHTKNEWNCLCQFCNIV